MNKCANSECQRETKNPRFCSRACAAIVNNASSPKRRPEGRCEGCGKEITTRRKLCPVCIDKAQADRAEADWQRKSFILRDGTRVAAPSISVSTCKSLVVETSINLAPSSVKTIGDLIDVVSAVCFSKPDYISKSQGPRFLTLLYEFRKSVIKKYRNGEWLDVPAENLEVAQIFLALETWVLAQFGTDDLLLPHYALEAGYFVLCLLRGISGFEPSYWRFEPLLGDEIFDNLRVDFLGQQFKSRFTREIRGEFVARVPIGCQVNSAGKAIFTEGAEFNFNIERCHLSENFYEFEHLKIEGMSESSMQLVEDLFLKASVKLVSYGNRSYPFFMRVPIDWVVYTVKFRDAWHRDSELLPVYQWPDGNK